MDHVLDAFLVKRRKRRKLITDDLHVLLAFVRQPLGNARFVIRQIGGLVEQLGNAVGKLDKVLCPFAVQGNQRFNGSFRRVRESFLMNERQDQTGQVVKRRLPQVMGVEPQELVGIESGSGTVQVLSIKRSMSSCMENSS